jgi:hypothetical protein
MVCLGRRPEMLGRSDGRQVREFLPRARRDFERNRRGENAALKTNPGSETRAAAATASVGRATLPGGRL